MQNFTDCLVTEAKLRSPTLSHFLVLFLKSILIFDSRGHGSRQMGTIAIANLVGAMAGFLPILIRHCFMLLISATWGTST